MSESKEILPDINNIKSSESFTLPSKGLCYSAESKIPASITLRRMTTREDKMRMRNAAENVIKKDILQACILEDIDAGKLTITDANFLYFKLRVISLLDDTYKIRCICPNCGTEFIHQINLSEVPVKYLTKKAIDDLKVELPLSKQKIDFKLPTLDDMIRAGEAFTEHFEQFPDADRTEYLYVASRIMYIEKVNGQKLMSLELEDWLDSLDIIDNRAVSDITNQLVNLYGFVDDIIGQCPKCKSDVPHGLPITAELFTPSK